MIKIITTGREDLEDLWEKSNILTHFKRDQFPFLVFVEEENEIRVQIYKNVEYLVNSNYQNSTRVMVQWKGTWRSDFFHFNLGELREAYYKRYPKVSTKEMKKYYELYHKETGKSPLREGSETKIFRRWYNYKREQENRNKS